MRQRQQQQPQANVENGKILSVFRRSKAGGHGQLLTRPDRSGGTESSHHGKGWLPLTPSAGMEVMVAVVDGRRRRGPVYVWYFLYYSCRRHTRYLFFGCWRSKKRVPARTTLTGILLTIYLCTYERLHPSTVCLSAAPSSGWSATTSACACWPKSGLLTTGNNKSKVL